MNIYQNINSIPLYRWAIKAFINFFSCIAHFLVQSKTHGTLRFFINNSEWIMRYYLTFYRKKRNWTFDSLSYWVYSSTHHTNKWNLPLIFPKKKYYICNLYKYITNVNIFINFSFFLGLYLLKFLSLYWWFSHFY